jgi:hypothetical protein
VILKLLGLDDKQQNAAAAPNNWNGGCGWMGQLSQSLSEWEKHFLKHIKSHFKALQPAPALRDAL